MRTWRDAFIVLSVVTSLAGLPNAAFRIARARGEDDRHFSTRQRQRFRLFADALSRKWGKPVVVEDRTGAEATIGGRVVRG
jgi:hypothetical protein